MNPAVILLIGMIIVLGGILFLRLHPMLALLAAALVVGGLTTSTHLESFALHKGLSEQETNKLLNLSLGGRVAAAFGNTCAQMGILIALASIIGKCLLESGAAERVVRSSIKLSGQKLAPFSFMGSSFMLAAPVYFDTVFYLMIPLARTMGVRSRKAYPLFVMGIVSGGVMAHSLVPPTPGPLFVAAELGVSFGLMIIMGVIIGLICSASGLLYGYWLNTRQSIPLRDTADTSVEYLEKWSQKESNQMPSLLLSLSPILLPILLIAGNTIISNVSVKMSPLTISIFREFGNPNVALFISAVVSLIILYRHVGYRLKEIQKPVQDALYSGGTIILITASGGSFGAMLQQTDIGSWVTEFTPDYKLAVLPIAFIITAVIRTAQGSATVAMITAVGILSAFVSSGQLGFNPVYLAIVIGCGSKIFPWMNDSGFWIICKMSGFTEGETIRNFSVLLSVMGLTGLIASMILANLFPLL